MHMWINQNMTRLASLHGYGTCEETRLAVKHVKALFLLEKWFKFSFLIKAQNSAVSDKENP